MAGASIAVRASNGSPPQQIDDSQHERMDRVTLPRYGVRRRLAKRSGPGRRRGRRGDDEPFQGQGGRCANAYGQNGEPRVRAGYPVRLFCRARATQRQVAAAPTRDQPVMPRGNLDTRPVPTAPRHLQPRYDAKSLIRAVIPDKSPGGLVEIRGIAGVAAARSRSDVSARGKPGSANSRASVRGHTRSACLEGKGGER